MPVQSIPLAGISNNTEKTANFIGTQRLADGYIDAKGYLNKRPVLSRISTMTGTANYSKYGCIYWPIYNTVICFQQEGTGAQGGGDYIYELTNGDTYTQRAVTSTLASTEANSGTQRHACICRYSGQELLVSARGSKMCTYHPTTYAFTRIASSAPTNVVRPLYIDGYVLAQVASGNRVYYSNIDDVYTWDAADFFEAISVADDIVAVEIYNSRIYVFGTNSIEIFYNDGETPFRRLEGGTLNIGCLIGSSVKVMSDGIYFLDNNRKITRINDNGIEFLSDDIVSIIDGIQPSGVSDTTQGLTDTRIHEFYLDGNKHIMVTMPETNTSPISDYIQKGLTLVYDTVKKYWYEWTSWIYTNGTYGRTGLRVSFSAYAVGQNRTVFLLRNFSAFGAKLYSYAYTEIVREDTPISLSPKCEYQTGYIDWGSPNQKQSSMLSFRAKKTNIASNEMTVTSVNPDFSTIASRTISLTDGTDTSNKIKNVTLPAMGQYRVRQYKIEHSAAAPFIIGDLRETVEEMLG